MPLYECECEQCGKHEDVVLSIANYDNTPVCCGQKMRRLISNPFIQPDNTCYKSMVTGEMVTSRRRHREILKDHKLIEVGNEKIQPRKKSPSEVKQEKWELRRSIAQQLSARSA